MSRVRALVTGATSGLGREAALQLARRGWRVAVTGRRGDRLDDTARRVEAEGGEALALRGSSSDPADVRRHYAAIKDAWGGLDWALLNAGVSEAMDAKAFSAETVRRTMETNVIGVSLWLEAIIPDMVARGSGLIAGVSSLAAFRGLPKTGPYCASKAALSALLESTRIDLRGTGVDVVTVCPGFVRSEITDRNRPGSMPFFMETEAGVAAMLAGIDARRRVVHFPWPLSYPVRLSPLLPAFLYDWLAAALAPMVKKPR